MTWAPKETQQIIYETLTGDATLRALLIGATVQLPKIFDHVPDNEVEPYITLQALPWTDRGNHTQQGLAVEYQINVWYKSPGRGNKDVQIIQNRIDELLHEQDICIEGWNIIVLRRSLIDILTEDDNVTKHGIQRFKLFLGGI